MTPPAPPWTPERQAEWKKTAERRRETSPTWAVIHYAIAEIERLTKAEAALAAERQKGQALREAIRVEREEMGRGNTMADTTWLAALRWVTDRMDALGLSPTEPTP